MSCPRSMSSMGLGGLALAAAVLVQPLAGAQPRPAERPEGLILLVWQWSPEVDAAVERAAAELTEARGVQVRVLRVPRGLEERLEALRERGRQPPPGGAGPEAAGLASRRGARPPADYGERIAALLASRHPPDVLWIDRRGLARLVRAGGADLEDLARDPRLSGELDPRALAGFRHGGRLYGIPFGPESEAGPNALAISTSAPRELAFELVLLLHAALRGLPATGGAEGSLTLTIRSTLTDAGRSRLGDPAVLRDLDRLLGIESQRVWLGARETRVDTFDAAGAGVFTVVLHNEQGAVRGGRLLDHQRRTSRALRVPGRLPSVRAWIVGDDDPGSLAVLLGNGCLLRAEGSHDVSLAPHEARGFWRDVLWIENESDEAGAFWAELGKHGLPRRVELADAASGEVLVRLEVEEARRSARPPPAGGEDYRPDPAAGQPLAEALAPPEAAPAPGGVSLLSGTLGGGEHVGWLVAPSLVDEVKTLLNKVVAVGGTFEEVDPTDGALKIDWYDRAEKKLGGDTKNAFTILREILKTAVAMYILPRELAEGTISSELKGPFEQMLKTIIADKKVPPDRRFCVFLQGLEKPRPELGGAAPTAQEHEEYRRGVLLDLVEAVIRNRFATLKVPALKPLEYSCWAFDFKAYNFKLHVWPDEVLKGLTVTPKGLTLDLGIERVVVDLEYRVLPAVTPGNVALCIFTGGVANIVELDYGPGEITAKKILLSLELTPKLNGKQIGFEVGLGQSSHAALEYKLYGTNILTFGKMEIISTILTFANAFEGRLLEAVGEKLKSELASFLPPFPSIFHFADAPPVVLERDVVASTPGKALLVGAVVELPKETVPVPLPSTPPSLAGDFAISLATEYLGGVLTWRLEAHRKAAALPAFQWQEHVGAGGLPPVKLPQGYTPPDKASKFPQDFEDNEESWAITDPRLELATLAALPAPEEPVGTIRLTMSYRLTRNHYAWRGAVRRPEVDPRLWWLERWGPGPVARPPLAGDFPAVDLEQFLTLRYGAYRQANGQVVSRPPAFLGLPPQKVNPSQAAHAVDVGGIVVEWAPFAVATDEHLNVQVEVEVPAHIELTSQIGFLPELDLTYGKAKVRAVRLEVSPTLSGLKGEEAIFEKLVGDYLEPLLKAHPFSKKLIHSYLNAYLLCGNSYGAFRKGEKAVNVVFTIVSMLTASVPQKLWIERHGERLVVNFDFLGGL